MILKSITEARSELSELVDIIQKGASVVITKAGKPVARLVPYQAASQPRVPGLLAGEIKIHDDFDAPLPPEIAKAFGMTPPKKRSR